ncbi:molybdate ABC transporter substrate-binding protein [soil metagenome]
MRYFVAGIALLLAACFSQSSTPHEILVAAASDLAGAMPELAAAFEASTGVRVVATLGSSGQLAQQTLQGAPVDVFLSADEGWIDRLEAAGRLEPGTRSVYAYGMLVLLAGRQTEPPATVMELDRAAYARIALANPEHAPYGVAARQALESAGIYHAVQDRLVLAENVRQTVQFAESRAVDVSIAALSLMDSARHRWNTVPTALHQPLAQTAAVIAGSQQTDAARAFVGFLLGPQGREILARYRFVLP